MPPEPSRAAPPSAPPTRGSVVDLYDAEIRRLLADTPDLKATTVLERLRPLGETDEALLLLERSARLLEVVVTADPADVTTRSRVAENSLGLGHAYMVLASSPELTADARLARWRQAKAQLEKGAAFWVEMRDRGVTVGEPGRQARPNRPRDRQV